MSDTPFDEQVRSVQDAIDHAQKAREAKDWESFNFWSAIAVIRLGVARLMVLGH